VNNVAPIPLIGGALVTVDEGDPAINVGTFFDPGDDVVTITASVGTITQSGGASGSCSWSFPTTDGVDETQTVTITATDSDGASDIAAFGLTVNNVAPTPVAGSSTVTVNEGDPALNAGTFFDPGDDVVTVTASVGTITQTAGASGTWSWLFSTDDGPADTQIVTITATDSDGASDTTTFALVVDNVAPTPAADSGSVTVAEGAVAANTGSFFDPGDDFVTITASIGSISQTAGATGTWAWSFQTTDGPDESQSVTITATDSDGGSEAITFALIVNNAASAPLADNASVAVPEGATALNTGTFNDPGDDTVTVTASVGSITQSSGASGTWAWSFATVNIGDTQTVTITATDSDGAAAITTFALTVNLNAFAPVPVATSSLVTVGDR
jgi:hypothetical protein